jgi:hypothetical protein
LRLYNQTLSFWLNFDFGNIERDDNRIFNVTTQMLSAAEATAEVRLVIDPRTHKVMPPATLPPGPWLQRGSPRVPATHVTVQRYVSSRVLSEVIARDGQILVVRTAQRQNVNDALFAPVVGAVLLRPLRTTDAATKFRAAANSLRCGSKWTERSIPKVYRTGSIGTWHMYSNERCARELILRGKTIEYQSISLAHVGLTYGPFRI